MTAGDFYLVELVYILTKQPKVGRLRAIQSDRSDAFARNEFSSILSSTTLYI